MIYSFVVSFILGIAFESIWSVGWTVGVLVFFISLILSLLFFRSQGQPFGTGAVQGLPLIRLAREENQGQTLKGLTLVFVGVAFFLGVLRMSVVDHSPDSTLSKFVNQKISFEAVISGEADIRDTTTRYIVTPNFYLMNQNSLNENFLEENKISKSNILLVANRFPEFKYGDRVKVSGKLELPKNFTNENGDEFDYISYLSKDKIHFLMYRPEIDPTSSSSTGLRGTRKIVSALYFLKNIFIENISEVVPEPNSSLLGGLIFGVKQSLGTDLLDDFRKVGLIHIVVLSGYNITIIAAGIFFAVSFFGKQRFGFIVSAISIALFAIMVGLGATVIRASIMALIAILARFLGRPADALRWLFVAGLLMLLWNPLILFYDPSFQLSFMATLGLILFSPFIYSFISKNKFLKLIPEKFALREIVSATIAVQFFVLPLLIRMSGFVSLVSFIINPLVLPLVPWAMAAGALTGALGIIPLVGTIISWPIGILSYFISQIIIGATELGASLPLATLQTGTISLWMIALWYVGYGFLYRKLNTSPQPDKSGLPLS